MGVCGADNPIYCDIHNYYDIANAKTPLDFPIKFYNKWLDANHSKKNHLFATLDYFDVQNFVPYIKVPTVMVLSALDPIAPPSCVYATFNKLSDKTKRISEINILQDLGHEITREYGYLKSLWIEENISNATKH